MATYKVIQDIEAEDKLLGPLTLKGFIYAGITGVLIFLNFKIFVSTAGPSKYIFILLFLPLMILFGILASPLGREQPTEVWLLARIRFFIKPRRRLWDQTGISKLVTVTAPVKPEVPRTKGFSEQEVRSRLQTLAVTLDSRGWAIKNLTLPQDKADSDRLIAPTTTSHLADTTDIRPEDDIMDENHNATAKNFNSLIDEADAQRKIGLAKSLNKVRKETAKLSAKTQSKASTKTPAKTAKTEVTPQERAAKLELAQSGNALSVASVAKLANRQGIQLVGPNEVLINLH
jgi:hypothetical protein